MRIIAGKYRGRNLKCPPLLQVRPTSDRLRETLFNVIAPRIQGARFLDLCAGSGAVGIEALSRSASHVAFVDKSRKMCALVEANLELCRIPEEQTEVVQAEAHDFLSRVSTPLRTRGLSPQSSNRKVTRWDIVFFDPPYATDYLPVLELFGWNNGNLLKEDGLLIVEHHHKNSLPDEVGSIIRSRILKQGDSALSFFETLNPSASQA
ncbi:MAG: 16S rRNA (guanine(966)-N(2))-methyltransferase RsmD [bacterium]